MDDMLPDEEARVVCLPKPPYACVRSGLNEVLIPLKRSLDITDIRPLLLRPSLEIKINKRGRPKGWLNFA